MKEKIYFTASADLVRRAGIIASRYRTKDGRYVIDGDDLAKVSMVMTPYDYIHGIDVIQVSEIEAKNLIAENGYQMGEEYVPDSEPETEQEAVEAEEETTEDTEE